MRKPTAGQVAYHDRIVEKFKQISTLKTDFPNYVADLVEGCVIYCAKTETTYIAVYAKDAVAVVAALFIGAVNILAARNTYCRIAALVDDVVDLHAEYVARK